MHVNAGKPLGLPFFVMATRKVDTVLACIEGNELCTQKKQLPCICMKKVDENVIFW